MLGEAGATVYCTGRSIRGTPSELDRPETIEETAEMVSAHGGLGIWHQVDHTKPAEVALLFERVREEQSGQLDLLVDNITGDGHIRLETAFVEHSLIDGLLALEDGVHTRIITSYYAVPLMIAQRSGLIIEITDGNYIGYNSAGLYYSLTKTSANLLAYFLAKELKQYEITALSLTPGYLRSERMLAHFGVTKENWRDAIAQDEVFAHSESPYYVGRAVVALATDPNILLKSGRSLSAGWLARDYGFTDLDGSQPPGYFEKEGVFTGLGFEMRK
jgi:NAD(P)-dependent dehydrogenase (short-subunit alcohol dehydrogenase family)